MPITNTALPLTGQFRAHFTCCAYWQEMVAGLTFCLYLYIQWQHSYQMPVKARAFYPSFYLLFSGILASVSLPCWQRHLSVFIDSEIWALRLIFIVLQKVNVSKCKTPHTAFKLYRLSTECCKMILFFFFNNRSSILQKTVTINCAC